MGHLTGFRRLNDRQLIEFLLTALAERQPPEVVEPITAEILKRDLVDRVLAEAQARRRTHEG